MLFDETPVVSSLPFVLESAGAARHMLPYGKKDRPNLRTAWPTLAKGRRDLVPLDFPGLGIWPKFVIAGAAQAADLLGSPSELSCSCCNRAGS